MPHVKPITDALSFETYAKQKLVRFKLAGVGESSSDPALEVEIPVQIAFRIHFLLRAYDGQAVRSLEPRGMYQIEFMKLQRLVSELELLSRALADPVTLHYLAMLISLVKRSSAYPSSVLIVIAP